MKKKYGYKPGKTIRGCWDKHQGNLFERDGARKVSLAGEASGDSTSECVPFVPSVFAFLFGHEACRSAGKGTGSRIRPIPLPDGWE